MIPCIEKCQKKLETHKQINKIILYDFFIETWGRMSINGIDLLLEKIEIISKLQNKMGIVPSEIKFCLYTYIPKYNNSILMNSIYIIILYTLNPIISHQNLLDKYSYQVLICIQYLRSNYSKYKGDCFQNIFVYQALNFIKEIYKSQFELEDSSINEEMEKIKQWTYSHYWNGQYFRTKNYTFCQKINAFAILFNFVDETAIQKIIKSKRLLSCLEANLNNQILFLLACIKWSNLNWIEEKLQHLEKKYILVQNLYSATCSLYITCRLTLEKEKLIR